MKEKLDILIKYIVYRFELFEEGITCQYGPIEYWYVHTVCWLLDAFMYSFFLENKDQNWKTYTDVNEYKFIIIDNIDDNNSKSGFFLSEKITNIIDNLINLNELKSKKNRLSLNDTSSAYENGLSYDAVIKFFISYCKYYREDIIEIINSYEWLKNDDINVIRVDDIKSSNSKAIRSLFNEMRKPWAPHLPDTHPLKRAYYDLP